MLSPDQILRLAQAYAAAKGVALSTVGTHALTRRHHKVFNRLVEGKGVTARTLELAEIYFDANWPDTPWPPDIPRPRRRKCAA